MNIRWKTSALNNLTDARYFNAMEDSWLSFQFDVLAEQAVKIEDAKVILEWLPDANTVAVFGSHQDESEIEFVMNSTNIHYLQLDIHHPIIHATDYISRTFIELNPADADLLNTLPSAPFATVLHPDGFSQKQTAFILQAHKQFPESLIFLKLNPDLEEVKTWVNALSSSIPLGIELAIIPEERPGWSSVDIYDDIIQYFEEEV